MRKRFEPQIIIGQKQIKDIEVNLKSRHALSKLVLALKKIFVTPEYNEKVLDILEEKILKNKKKTGRPGMNLWTIFVLAQTRLCLNMSYDMLHDMANNHTIFRQILGIESREGYERIELEYQNIVDNVDLLDDLTLKKINDIIVKLGHTVFKKKETVLLCLKTDSFVVESKVHYPTDYNLLWDSARKCIDVIYKILNEYPEIKGFRNLYDWKKKLKNKLRELTLSAKKSKEEKIKITTEYIEKAKLFSEKINNKIVEFENKTIKDAKNKVALEYYLKMLEKHIDLLERRVLKGETIPHDEKIFSIFETYTEWITKGKQNPSFELGKNIQITSDQFHLIIDYKIMEKEVDKTIVKSLSESILSKYKIDSWSFDKGYFSKENKAHLLTLVPNLVMSKKGKLSIAEKEEEHKSLFKKLRNKHSAVESNINALENKGLDICPDKGYEHFKRYIGMGVCAYNLHLIGAEILRQEKLKLLVKKVA